MKRVKLDVELLGIDYKYNAIFINPHADIPFNIYTQLGHRDFVIKLAETIFVVTNHINAIN